MSIWAFLWAQADAVAAALREDLRGMDLSGWRLA